MKIVFFGDAIAEHLYRWTRYFAKLGHEVHVITWNHRILAGYEPVIIHQLHKPLQSSGVVARAVTFARLRREVRRLLKELQPDIVHAHDAGSYAWMAMLSGFHPFLVTPWGSDILVTVHHDRLARFFMARTLRRADLLQAEGEDTRDALLRLGATADKIVVLPIGVDVDKFKPGDPSPEFDERHGLAGSPVVVSTRTLNPIHDVETTIRAAALVVQKMPAVKFLIVGDGSESHALRQLGESLGIGRSLVFTGYVAEEQMIACLQAADAYVSTSLSDSGTPASTAEAMACGLAVVSTDAGNIRQRLCEGEGGYVTPCKDHLAVAENILHLLDHGEERQRAGRRNRLYVEEHINAHKIMKQMEDIYSRLAAATGKAKISR